MGSTEDIFTISETKHVKASHLSHIVFTDSMNDSKESSSGILKNCSVKIAVHKQPFGDIVSDPLAKTCQSIRNLFGNDRLITAILAGKSTDDSDPMERP